MTDNLARRDYRTDGLERINHEICVELDHKNQVISTKQLEIYELKYKLQDSDTLKNGLKTILKTKQKNYRT